MNNIVNGIVFIPNAAYEVFVSQVAKFVLLLLPESRVHAGTLHGCERPALQKNIVSSLPVTKERKKNAVRPGTVSS